jgi:hypothetical protein
LWVTIDSTKLPGYGKIDSTYVWDELNEVDENDNIEEDNYDIDYTN